MRILFIGTVQFSKDALLKLIELKANVVGVITKDKSSFNSDFADLKSICDVKKIDCICVDKINDPKVLDFSQAKRPDIIFCFGWSALLAESFLTLAPMGVVGYHPALLPKNRGRHPLIWALALGLKETGSTFFFMDKGADSGDILSQRKIPVSLRDNAATLYQKMTRTALLQIKEFLPALQKGRYTRIKQDHARANSWRKRQETDGQIDWRMSSRVVYNLVRALTKPYPGAYFLYKGKKIIVWDVQEVKLNDQENIEPGKVLSTNYKRKILVKTGDKAVCLKKSPFLSGLKKGDYL